jgi:hypothetical protein
MKRIFGTVGVSRRWRLAAALSLAVVGMALVGVAGAGASASEYRTVAAGAASVYTDASGDSASAPDIQKVVLTDGGNGTVAVEIDLAATIPNDGSSGVIFAVDADSNPATGNDQGWDYAVIANATGAALVKWDGSNFSDFTHQPISPGLNGGTLTFTLTLADLGSPTAFDFVVGGANGNDVDVAPDSGEFHYPLVVAKPTIKSIIINSIVLAAPKAGKIFRIPSVQVTLSTDEIVTADSVSCTLTYKGHAIKRIGPCAWRIPLAYRHKHLTLHLIATYQGATGTLMWPITPR